MQITGHFLKFLTALVACAWLLIGCSQADMVSQFENGLPKEPLARAEKVLEQITSKDYAAIKQQMDPKFMGENFDHDFRAVMALVPDEKPLSTKPIGSFTNSFNNEWTRYTLSFEQQYSKEWMLAAVVFQLQDGELRLVGLNMTPTAQSLEQSSVFTFAGKSALHYLLFGLAIVIPLFILLTLVVCWRTPIAKRKWLWMLFIAVGVVVLNFRWSDGAYDWRLLYVTLLGAGIGKGGPYAPWILSVSIPLGAILFWIRRPALLRSQAATVPPDMAPAKPDASGET